MFLAIRKDGRLVRYRWFSIEELLAAAVLLELYFQGVIQFKINTRKSWKLEVIWLSVSPLYIEINPVDYLSLDDSILRDALTMVESGSSLERCIERISAVEWLFHRVTSQLCYRDVITVEQIKIFRIFNRRMYHVIDPRPRQQLIERLHTAILNKEAELSPRDIFLISLANSMNLITKEFDSDSLPLEGNQEVKWFVERRISEIIAKNSVAQRLDYVMNRIVSSHRRFLPLYTP